MTTGAPDESMRGRGLLRHRRIVGQSAWGIGDQALSSLSNIALTVIVARNVSPESFGEYGIAYVVFALTLGFSRSLWGDPLVIRYSGTAEAERETAIGHSALMVVATGALLTVGLLLCGTLLGSDGAGPSLVALGVVIPFVLLQDFGRYCCFAQGNARAAVVLDTVWVVAQIAAIGTVIIVGATTAPWFIVGWGAAAAISAIAAWWVIRWPWTQQPHLIEWLREALPYSLRYLGDFLAVSGTIQVILLVLGAIVGVEIVGALRGGQVLFGPLNILNTGLLVILTAEAGRRWASVGRDSRLVATCVAGSALAAAAAGALLLVLVVGGDVIGPALLGESWDLAEPVIVPIGLANISAGAALGAIIGLRVLIDAKTSLRARLITVPFMVIGGIGGGIYDGAVGAAIGLCVASWMSIVTWWVCFRFSLTVGEHPQPGDAEAQLGAP